MKISERPQLSHIAAGITAVVVGYSSAVVIVIEAAKAAGATPDMIISWLLMLGLGMGVTCIVYSRLYKIPVVTAWSTPGAAFLIGAVDGYSINEIIGSFVTAAILALFAAQNKTLTRYLSKTPPAISSALLAGILLPICLNIFVDGESYPYLVAGFLTVYFIGSLFFTRYLMLVLLALAMVFSILMQPDTHSFTDISLPEAVWVTPHFTLSATVSLAIPLFIITLLSQNLPGIAIAKSHDYEPGVRNVLSGVSVVNIVTAPFGGFAFNFAAITAALCMGESAGEDRALRYWAAIIAGVGYIFMGLAAPVVVMFFSHMPAVIVHLLAGLALLATLQASLLKSMENHKHRKAALVTLLCTASGVTVAQLGAPVWGLVLGLAVVALDNVVARKQSL